MIGENLLRFQKDLKIVFADSETEGLHTGKSRPWQFAFIVYHGDKLVDEQNLFPWWDNLNVSAGAAIVTHFNHESYKRNSINPKEARAKWLKYRNDPSYRYVLHNGIGYDSMIDAVWARELGEEPDYSWLERIIDTNAIAKGRKKGQIPDTSSPKAFLAWQIKMASIIEKGLKTNLAALGKEFNIDYDYASLHDGLNDIYLNKLVFDKEKWVSEI